jgi:hypothetical protein
VILNRWWFDLPYNFLARIQKTPIIGVRSMYLYIPAMQIRFRVQINWRYINLDDASKYDDKVINILLSSRIDSETGLKEVIKSFNKVISTRIAADNAKNPNKTPLNPKALRIEYRYDYIKGDIELNGDAVRFILHDESTVQIAFTLIGASTDAIAIFGNIFNIRYVDPDKQNGRQVVICDTPIWDRDNVLVKASFANVDQENFLGHTRSTIYTPIKYFRTTSTDQKFLLEFYLADDNTKLAIFPVEKKTKIIYNENGDEVSIDYYDPLVDVMIESVLLFNADSII